MRVRQETGNAVRDRSFELAVAVVRLCKRLQRAKEYVFSRQLLKSGTSVGANVEEALAAQSRRDFLARMTIAHKEARETLYWLRLLHHTRLISGSMSSTVDTAREVIKLLSSITKTTREHPDSPPPPDAANS